ncbi:MAG TPA: hypothetical protein VFZ36_01610, partial [Vicinamibacterales bacterium]
GIAQRRRGAGAPKSGRACDLLTAPLIHTGHRACACSRNSRTAARLQQFSTLNSPTLNSRDRL